MSSFQNQGDGSVSNFYFYTFILLMIITGSINTIANKLQFISTSLGQDYNHSYFVTFLMFLGESLCLIIYTFKNENKEKPKEVKCDTENINLIANGINNEKITEESEKPEATPFMLILPALCDFCASTIMTIGLSMLAGSTYQMMRGSLILFTALFSRIFLNSKLFLHHYVALSTVITGLVLVGAANVFIKPIFPQGCGLQTEDSSTYLGFILVIIGQIFAASQLIIEEKYMKNYKCHPLKAVGWEGVWGSLFYLLILVIFQNIQCPNPVGNEKNWATFICTKNDVNQFHLEDSVFALKQISNNNMLLFYTLLYITSIAVFNFVGITVSKIASSSSRAVIDTVRTVVIWGFFIMPIVDKCKREHFNWIQLGGFVLLILGTLVYNEIISLPFGEKKKNPNENNEINKEIKEN